MGEYLVGIYPFGGKMQSIKIKANGKINITLDVMGKRPDGYHEVEMLMQSIDLCDYVTITKVDDSKAIGGVSITSNSKYMHS